MGMFDYVDYVARCEKCGEQLTDFQSKDGPCELKLLRPNEVDYFYADCPKCRTWHDFNVHRRCFVEKIDTTIQEVKKEDND